MRILKKRCRKCLVVLSTDNFWAHDKGKHGLRARCKKCMVALNAVNVTRFRSKPGYKQQARSFVYKQKLNIKLYELKYKISEVEYEQILDSQNQTCWACGKFNAARRFSLKRSGIDNQEHLYCQGCTWFRMYRRK